MSREPSILDQLNFIIDYMNYHGHLFLRITSKLEPDDLEEIDIAPTMETL